MSTNSTLFTNDAGSSAGTSAYVQDVFVDVSLDATNNSGLTDSASTNPLGVSVANDDTPRFGPKTLWVQDFLLLDRSKWVSNKPTYQVLFQENYYGGIVYAFGDIDAQSGMAKGIGDGFGATGVFRRIQFILSPSIQGTATAQLALDGSNTSTVDFSAANPDGGLSAYVHSASNETKDLHDIRLTALQTNNLKLVGIVLYSENSGANLDFFPGTTYANKSKNTTTVGGTAAIPAYGSSLGGVSVLYKSSGNAYAISSLSATSVISIAQGSTGTNLATVTTGQGGSYLAGMGVVIPQGSSMYVGSVSSVSTDTLTLSPTLPFGISNTIYSAWRAGSTLSINASLMTLAAQVDFSQVGPAGISQPIYGDLFRYCAFGSNLGVTNMSSLPSAYFLGGSGFLQVDGVFSAAEVEFTGNGILHATMSVNGVAGYSINAGQTGPLKKTVFTDAAQGWNSFVIGAAASMGLVGINKINLYRRASDTGVTYGRLAEFSTHNAYTERTAENATLMALGLHRRAYADQLFLQGNWVRGQTTTASAGVLYYGASTNCTVKFQYYGKNFALVGTAASALVTIDGVSTANTFNAFKTVASEGFHTVAYTHLGATAQIQAIDYVRTYGEISNLQKKVGDV